MSSGFAALLDSVVGILDDVAALSKKATAKTIGVAGDDLAVSATQMAHVKAERELAVVARIAAFSAINKAFLIPLAILVSAISPMLLTVILVLGGLYLCVEGGEKVLSLFLPDHDESAANISVATRDGDNEKRLVKGAIKTDFVLSAEIIVIAMGEVASFGLGHQIAALCAVGVIMTVGVYGLVAAIVKIDDVGLWLMTARRAVWRRIGFGLVASMPWLMRTISVVGTAAMFMVGGGILVHKISWLHDRILQTMALPELDFVAPVLLSSSIDLWVGIAVGVYLSMLWHVVRLLFRRFVSV